MNYFIDVEESDRSRNEILVLVGPSLLFILYVSVLVNFTGRRHNHLFPNIRPLSPDAILEIEDILIHAIGGM